MNKVEIATFSGNIDHADAGSIEADRAEYKQRVHSTIERVGLASTHSLNVQKAYTEDLQRALRVLNPSVRIVDGEKRGWELNSEGKFSVSIDWSTGEWEINGLD